MPHGDVGAYVTGHLETEDRRQFESHLANCESCRAELAELKQVGELMAIATPELDYPAGLESSVMDAIRAAGPQDAPAGGMSSATEPAASAAAATAPIATEATESAATTSKPRRSFFRIPRVQFGLGIAGLAAALVIAVFAGSQIGDDGNPGSPDVELAATLDSTINGESANVVVTKLTTGREVDFKSDDLPVLPTGEFYELWFVGNGDSPQSPHRISGGTFHPDEEGHTDVILHAAVDPAKFPRIEVTEEPGKDGSTDNGPVILSFGPRPS